MQISDMILGVNTISRKVSIVSVNVAGWSGSVLRPQLGIYGTEQPKKIFRL